jgi:hypothetical protein
LPGEEYPFPKSKRSSYIIVYISSISIDPIDPVTIPNCMNLEFKLAADERRCTPIKQKSTFKNVNF